MTLAQLLAFLAEQGVELRVDAGKLRVGAPQGVLTPELRALLSERKAEIIDLLSAPAAPQTPPIPRAARDAPLPLSFVQEELWLADQLAGGRSVFKVASVLRISGPLDPAVLQDALAMLIRRHESLRTTFAAGSGRVEQVVHPDMPVPIARVDLRHTAPAEQDGAAQSAIAELAGHSFDLGSGPLLRATLILLGESSALLHILVHHIVFDAWSINLLADELAACYSACLSGQAVAPHELPIQYADFAAWQRAWAQAGDLDAQRAYWQEALADLPPALILPADRPAGRPGSLKRTSFPFLLSPALSADLRRVSRDQGVTLFTTLLGAFAALLHRYSGQDDLLIGSPTSGRQRAETARLIGAFAYPLALRVSLDGGPTFRELLGRVHATVLGAFANQDLPFIQVSEIAHRQRDSRQDALLRAMFSFPKRIQPARAGDLTFQPVEELLDVTSGYDLALGMVDDEQQITGVLITNPDLFTPEAAPRIQRHLTAVLQALVADPDALVGAVALPGATQEGALDLSGALSGGTLHGAFARQAGQTPERIALDDGAQQLSYRALDGRADAIAQALLAALGDRPGAVALCLERGVDRVCALLGVLKAGRCCVLLDPRHPAAWQEQLVRAAGAVLVLGPAGAAPLGGLRAGPVLAGAGAAQLLWPAPPEVAPPDHTVALVLPASRAGTPVRHGSLLRRIGLLQQRVPLAAADVLAGSHTLDDDATALALLWPLLCGARLQLTAAEQAGLLAPEGVTVAVLASADLPDGPLPDAAPRPRALRAVLLDEPLPDAAARRRLAAFSDLALYTLYGHPEGAAQAAAPISGASGPEIGAALIDPAAGFLLLDRDLQPVPPGAVGEIWALAPEDPVSADAAPRLRPLPWRHGRWVVGTGDRGQLRAGGLIEVVELDARRPVAGGRRVCLDLIEAALHEDPAVAGCAALVRAGRAGPVCVAYVVPGQLYDAAQLRQRVEARLPAPLCPAVYVAVSNIPLLPDGRLDRARLEQLPLVDDALAQGWERQLACVPGIRQAAAVIQDAVAQPERLHLSDLLPGWSAAAGAAGPAERPQTAAGSEGAAAALALSDGGPLLWPEAAPGTLIGALERAAAEFPQQRITYIHTDGAELHQGYAELLGEAERILAGLRAGGLRPQDKLLFLFDRNQDFIPAFWACVLGGFVPVPLAVPTSFDDANSAVRRIADAWQMLGRPVLITRRALQPEIEAVVGRLGLEGWRVETVEQARLSTGDTRHHPAAPDDLALLMLTSGSTGAPKAVALSHHNLLCRSIGSQQMNGFSADDVSLNWMPLDHVAGIIFFHLRDVYLGCRQIHVATGLILQDPLRWIDYLDRHRVTVTFAPNFAFNLVNQRAQEIDGRSWDLGSVRSILNGAEAIVAKTARLFLRLLLPHGLPPDAMRPAWGMSETSSGVTYSDRFSLESTTDDDAFVEVGRPIAGVALRIVDDQNRVLPEGAVGQLQIRGLTVTAGYHQNPQLNQEVFTADGWFDTGDLGLIEGGRLTITGRKKDVIVINSVNYYCHEIESLVESLDGVEPSYTAVCAVRAAHSNTDQVALFFCPTAGDDAALLQVVQTIRSRVAQQIGISIDYLLPVARSDIPKTSIGKIQRSELRQMLQQGRFNSVQKRLDLLAANANTLPGWFYRKIWRRSRLAVRAPLGGGAALVWLDQSGLGREICDALRGQGKRCITVEPAPHFVQRGPHAYGVDPDSQGDYARLFEALAAAQTDLDLLIHLGAYDGVPAEIDSAALLQRLQSRGVLSLLLLVQHAVRLEHRAPRLDLVAVTARVQPVLPDEPVAYAHAPLVGLIKTVAQELPAVACRHIDLDPAERARHQAQLLDELGAAAPETEIAYRRGGRFARRIVPAGLDTAPKQELPFRQGGMYLLSGGLGGIGVEIARYLLETHRAKLLILGRTALPERDSWGSYDDPADPLARRVQALRALERLGGSLAYHAVDVCDPDAVARVVDQARRAWQTPLAGVIHLAGDAQNRLLASETPESFAGLMRSKVVGAWSLHQLLKGQPDALFLCFSSVNAFFGGFSVGAYAAANAFLDCFAHHGRREGLRSYSIGWSMWDGVGMNSDTALRSASYARGYHPINPAQGLHSLRAALHQGVPDLLIGLDGANPAVGRLVDRRPAARQRLAVYFSAAEGFDPGRLADLALADPAGGALRCPFIQLPELPLTASGAVDRAALAAAAGTEVSARRHVEPRDEVEERIAAIWKDVLQVDRVSVTDTFFDLGGHSILVAQVLHRLQQSFQREIAIVDLFKHPTVGALAAFLSEGGTTSTVLEDAQKRVDTRKALQEKQRQMRDQQRAARNQRGTK